MTFKVEGQTGSKWQLLEEKVFTATAQTYDFTPTVDGDNDGAYLVEGRLVNDTGSNTVYTPRLNGASIAGTRQYYVADGAGTSQARDNNMYVADANAGKFCSIAFQIPAAKSGDGRMMTYTYGRDGAAALDLSAGVFDITTPAVGTNITSVGVTASVAAAIGVGSVLRLWRRML